MLDIYRAARWPHKQLQAAIAACMAVKADGRVWLRLPLCLQAAAASSAMRKSPGYVHNGKVHSQASSDHIQPLPLALLPKVAAVSSVLSSCMAKPLSTVVVSWEPGLQQAFCSMLS